MILFLAFGFRVFRVFYRFQTRKKTKWHECDFNRVKLNFFFVFPSLKNPKTKQRKNLFIHFASFRCLFVFAIFCSVLFYLMIRWFIVTWFFGFFIHSFIFFIEQIKFFTFSFWILFRVSVSIYQTKKKITNCGCSFFSLEIFPQFILFSGKISHSTWPFFFFWFLLKLMMDFRGKFLFEKSFFFHFFFRWKIICCCCFSTEKIFGKKNSFLTF